MLSELQKGENEELKLKAQERNQVAQQDLNKEEKETLEREKADLQSQKVPPIRFIKKRALANIMIVKDQQIEENAKRINETDLALNATRQQLANQERANNELESEFIPKLAGQRAELNENRVRLTELREEIMSKDPSYFGFANQSEGETGGSAGNERQKEYQNIITQINNTVNVSDNPAQAAEQEKPLEQPQQQQPKTENQPNANKVEEEKEEEEKKKKKGSPQQSKQIRGQAWRAAKYSFLGGLCGLLLLATILLGVAGMLPIFFICLACTIGACIITSGEVTSDIKKANEESLKARTEQNKSNPNKKGKKKEKQKSKNLSVTWKILLNDKMRAKFKIEKLLKQRSKFRLKQSKLVLRQQRQAQILKEFMRQLQAQLLQQAQCLHIKDKFKRLETRPRAFNTQ